VKEFEQKEEIGPPYWMPSFSSNGQPIKGLAGLKRPSARSPGFAANGITSQKGVITSYGVGSQ
jgi:hypothetical protein